MDDIVEAILAKLDADPSIAGEIQIREPEFAESWIELRMALPRLVRALCERRT